MSTPPPDRFELTILGVPDLRAPDGRRLTSVLSQPSRLSLLAYLALAPGPVSRASVVADFWPESDETRARNALSQALFYLRRSMGKEVIENVDGDRLRVPSERVWCDAKELLEADHPSQQLRRAAADDLLAGWNAEGSQPLQEWLDGVRRRVRARAAELEAEDPDRVAPRSVRDASAPEELPSDRAPGVAPNADATGHRARDSGAQPAAAAPRPRHRLWAPLVGSAALVALLFAVVLPVVGRPAESERLAVLLPRVTQLTGSPRLDPLRLNAEIFASLPRRPDLEIVPAGFAGSLGELLGWRDAVDASPAHQPDWILEVSVVVSRTEVHVVTVVYEGPGASSPGSESFDLPYRTPEEVAIHVPRAIAERVAGTVSHVIGS